MSGQLERIHVIRYNLPDGTSHAITTQLTTTPAEWFEQKYRRESPNAKFKPTRSFLPEQFEALEEEADGFGITIDELIDGRE